MNKTTKSSTSAYKSNHNYSDQDANNEFSTCSSEEDEVTTRKSRKLQPTDAADYEEGGDMYDRGGRRRRGSRRGRSRRKRSRSRSRRRRR